MPGTFNTADARMPHQEISLGPLCGGNKDARIKFAVMNPNSNREFNSAITTIADLERGQCTLNVGGNATLNVDNFEVRVKPSFVDYLRAGWEVSLTVAIDYTASNGNPSDPSSLHFMGANNAYEAAIFNVGQVVEPYDSDKQFPTFGFGGIPRHLG